MPRKRTVDSTVDRAVNVTAHLANERTYLAWMRTGVVVITLGFAVATFGLSLSNSHIEHIELVTGVRASSLLYSDLVGISLLLVGGSMELFAVMRYRKRQVMINEGRYEPTSTAETILSVSIFLLAVLILGRILLRIIIKSY